MKWDLRIMTGLFFCLALMVGGPPVAILAFLGLAVYSLTGYSQALFALLFSAMIVILNPSLFPVKGSAVSMMRWLVLIAASLSIHIRSFYGARTVTNFPVVVLLVFVLLTVVLSNLFGYAPAVSNFKILVFALGSTAILQAYVSMKNNNELNFWLYHGASFFILGSLLVLLFFPYEAYRHSYWDGSNNGFKGITNQSQAMGIMVSIIIAWLVSHLSRAKENRNWQPYLLLILAAYFLVESRARTGLAALALAGMLTVFFSLFKPEWRKKIFGVLFRPATLLLLVVMTTMVAINFTSLREGVMDIVLKGGRNGQDLSQSFEASRGFRIKELYQSYLENKYTGIGFGLETNPEDFSVGYDPITGVLPIKAEVEKNFVFLSVFQETGVFGGSLFVLFILSMARFLLLHGTMGGLFLFLTGIALNIGEAIFFSLGGTGLFVWVLMMFCLVRKEST